VTGTPLLRGARLRLEPLEVAHADEMVHVLAAPELYRYTGGEPPSPAALRSRYARQVAGSGDPLEQWHTWVVRDGDDGPAVGYVQATVRTSGPGAGREDELAWVVAPQWQGRGIARDAAALARDALLLAGATRFVAHVHPDHVASQRVAAALGLEPTTRLVEGEVEWVRDEERGAGTTGRPAR
jgi:RimJ/RimL family protein N-acetyltransferase